MTPFVLIAIILLGLALLLIFAFCFLAFSNTSKDAIIHTGNFLIMLALVMPNIFIISSLKKTCPSKL